MKAITPDKPLTKLEEDCFGYVKIAQNIANKIRDHSGKEPLVLGLYGSWGSGKSTVLNYVKHYLGEIPETERPIIMNFNPWWFSGQENLLRAFFGQLNAALRPLSWPFEMASRLSRFFGQENLLRAFFGQLNATLRPLSWLFEKVSKLFGWIAKPLAWVIDLFAMYHGVASDFRRYANSISNRKPKDVQALEKKLRESLGKAKRRILIVVDDIDRLTPEEIRLLFKAIKAHTDFPNVIYLLALDRKVAVKALGEQKGISGEKFLDKIIQVPLNMPTIDHAAFDAHFAKLISEKLGEAPDGLFDSTYWNSIYYPGIHYLIRVPRDIVRFANATYVIYPAVREEINAVDFLALEAIRIFLPDLHDTILNYPEMFCGNKFKDTPEEYLFHERWLKKLPRRQRNSTHTMLQRIFPKLQRIEINEFERGEWHKKRRVCHPDVLPIYFYHDVPVDTIGRVKMKELLASASSTEGFAESLISAKDTLRNDGLSRAPALLDTLKYYASDLPSGDAVNVIYALFRVGDELINANERKEPFFIGNTRLAARLIGYLLMRVPKNRYDILENAIRNGRALAVGGCFLDSLDEQPANPHDPTGEHLLGNDEISKLKGVWAAKVSEISSHPDFMNQPELWRVLPLWGEWSENDKPKSWCTIAVRSEEGLLNLLGKLLWRSPNQTELGQAVNPFHRLNPDSLKGLIDIEATAERLKSLQDSGGVQENAEVAVSQFLSEYEMIKNGQNPDAGLSDRSDRKNAR